MKTAYIFLLILGFGQAFSEPLVAFGFSATTPKNDMVSQARPVVIEYLMSELIRIDKAILDLPFSKEYIMGTLMPEIEAKRKLIAPNYPIHEVTIENQTSVQEEFNEWNLAHPDEFVAYIMFIDQYVAEHK